MIPWYTQISISTGLGLLTAYVHRSKLSPERKQSFDALMVQVNIFIADLSTPA